jgi:hypothetical protein
MIPILTLCHKRRRETYTSLFKLRSMMGGISTLQLSVARKWQLRPCIKTMERTMPNWKRTKNHFVPYGYS